VPPVTFSGKFSFLTLTTLCSTAIPEASIEALRQQVAALQGMVAFFPVKLSFPYFTNFSFR
jgi:hypothetical protein